MRIEGVLQRRVVGRVAHVRHADERDRGLGRAALERAHGDLEGDAARGLVGLDADVGLGVGECGGGSAHQRGEEGRGGCDED